MYLLDTNICIYAMKSTYSSLTQKLFQVPPSDIFVSSITLGELEYGCAKSKWGQRSRDVMHLFLSAYTILPFDSDDATLWGSIRADLAAKGSPIGPYDIQLAAQSISKGLILVTHNTREFERVPSIVLEDWAV